MRRCVLNKLNLVTHTCVIPAQITNCQILARSLKYRVISKSCVCAIIDNEKLANECARFSAVIVKIV